MYSAAHMPEALTLAFYPGVRACPLLMAAPAADT